MDEKLEYFKKKILAHLDDLEQKENAEKKELKKSLLAFEMTSIEKAGYPVGTIREWKGKKYIKVAPGKWKPKYDSHSRGAKMAIAALKKKIDACTDSEELMQIILENRDRFSDENGRPLPFVKELSDYISGRNDTIESEKNEKKATDENIKNHFAEKEQDDKETSVFSNKDLSDRVNKGKKLIDEYLEKYLGDKNISQNLLDLYAVGDAKRYVSVNYNSTFYKNLSKEQKKQASEFNEKLEQVLEEYASKRLAEKQNNTSEAETKQSKQREQISDFKSEFEDNYRQMLENEDDRYKEDEKIKRGKEIDALVDSKAKEYAEDSYTKHVAQDSIKRLGEKKLTQYANLNVKDDKEFLSELKKKIAETEEKNGEPVSEYTIGTAVWNHYHKKYAKEFAQEKLKTMYQNEQDKGEDIPVDEKDMGEAENIIGADVKRILEGRDTFGNAKQGLVDKIKRRIRNNPGVARAMLVYIQKEQEKTGKKVFTDKHSIWEELPKLNENARKAKANGESETKTGVSGNLYEGEDGTTVVENKDWGRYQISFPGKPDGETISMLKRNGFRWSPSTKTWVCFNTANGEYSLKRVAEKLGLKKNDEVKKSLFDSLEDSFPYDDEMDSEDEIKKAVADVLDELAQGDK